MTYLAQETGGATGQPIELYQWTHASETYRYTSAQSDQTAGGATFTAAPVMRGTVSQGEEINRAALEVTVPQDHPVALLFSAGPPVDRVLLTIWRRHATDPLAEVVVLWQGRVLSCEWAGANAVLSHEPVWTAIRRTGLRRTWGYQCPHLLGSAPCGVNLVSYAIAGTVDSVSGPALVVVAAAGAPDGHWVGGMLTASKAGRTPGMVVGHGGPNIGAPGAGSRWKYRDPLRAAITARRRRRRTRASPTRSTSAASPGRRPSRPTAAQRFIEEPRPCGHQSPFGSSPRS
jgi:hypothetical protein